MKLWLRFSIRDMLWLTLVVAVALGWFSRERQLRAELDVATDHTAQWRTAAGGLEDAVSVLGWKVQWNFELSQVRLWNPTQFSNTGTTKAFAEPTSPPAGKD